MNSAFEEILVEALDALEAGEPIEEILAAYPAEADRLRPILETTAQLASLPVAHALSAQAVSRDIFLQRANTLRSQENEKAFGPLRRFFSTASILASLAVFVLILGGVLASAAQNALPGQALYSVKRTVEDVRLSLATGPEARDVLREQFRVRRQAEIFGMLARDLEGRVDCTGEIEAIAADSWTLSGLQVEIGTGTQIEGRPRPGAIAQGTCLITEGRIVAERLRVEDTAELPDLTPSPTAGPTTTPTITPTPSPTNAPSQPEPSATFAPPPPAQPAENDGVDDNPDEDGGGEDNDDSDDDNDGEDGEGSDDADVGETDDGEADDGESGDDAEDGDNSDDDDDEDSGDDDD